MADMAGRIARYLAEDEALVEIVEDRILDFDYRTAGWNTAPVDVFDADGIILPTIVVDDNGGVRPFGTPMEAEDGSVYIWVFSSRSRQGQRDVDQINDLVKARLAGWHDPETKQLLRWSFRVGIVTADDGVYDRTEYRIAGIPARA